MRGLWWTLLSLGACTADQFTTMDASGPGPDAATDGGPTSDGTVGVEGGGGSDGGYDPCPFTPPVNTLLGCFGKDCASNDQQCCIDMTNGAECLNPPTACNGVPVGCRIPSDCDGGSCCFYGAATGSCPYVIQGGSTSCVSGGQCPSSVHVCKLSADCDGLKKCEEATFFTSTETGATIGLCETP